MKNPKFLLKWLPDFLKNPDIANLSQQFLFQCALRL